jgi:ketosteroid isomerase-like protein
VRDFDKQRRPEPGPHVVDRYRVRKLAAIQEAITRRDSAMTRDNEAVVRNAYHAAEGNVLDIPGWTGSFTEDGVFNNVPGEASYTGGHLKDVVITFAKMFPDIHRELHRVNVMGDVIAIELSIQGTFRGSMQTPAGVIQPTGAKVDIPCADFFYMRNGKIERFDCYPALNIMLKQMGIAPDFASAVKR